MPFQTTFLQTTDAPDMTGLDTGHLYSHMPQRMQALTGLIDQLNSYLEPHDADRTDRQEFARLFQLAQQVLEMDDLAMAQKLKVSRPTVGRWARAETAPYPIARPAVFQVIADLANEKIKFHQGYEKKHRMKSVA